MRPSILLVLFDDLRTMNSSALPLHMPRLDAIARGNPVEFFDITIGGVPSGRIKMELFSDETPKTAENFRRMCTGEFTRGSQPAGRNLCHWG